MASLWSYSVALYAALLNYHLALSVLLFNYTFWWALHEQISQALLELDRIDRCRELFMLCYVLKLRSRKSHSNIYLTWDYFLLFIAMRYLCWSCSIFWLWFRVIASSVCRARIRRVRFWAALFGNEHDRRVKVWRAFPWPELGVALFFLRHPL